jgi:hypothetical protein
MSGSIEALTSALEENTSVAKQLLALYQKVGVAAEVTYSGDVATEKTPPAAKNTTGKGKAAETNKPKHTVEEVAAAAVKVKEDLGTAAAQALIKEAGQADKLKEMKPEFYDAFVTACELALSPDGGTAAGEDDL